MADLISRQAAINETWREPRYTDALNALTEIRERIRSLPSAQQEIIRCKDCKYNDYEEQNSTTRWLPCIDAAWPDDWFCGCAERRKDG